MASFMGFARRWLSTRSQDLGEGRQAYQVLVKSPDLMDAID